MMLRDPAPAFAAQPIMGMVIIACAPPSFAVGDEIIAVGARCCGAIGDGFQNTSPPRRLVRVDLPVITRLLVAAGTVQRNVQILQILADDANATP